MGPLVMNYGRPLACLQRRKTPGKVRHRLRHNVRATALGQALRLRTPRRLHPAPAQREAGHHLVLAAKVVKIQPRNNMQAANNLYN